MYFQLKTLFYALLVCLNIFPFSFCFRLNEEFLSDPPEAARLRQTQGNLRLLENYPSISPSIHLNGGRLAQILSIRRQATGSKRGWDFLTAREARARPMIHFG